MSHNTGFQGGWRGLCTTCGRHAYQGGLLARSDHTCGLQGLAEFITLKMSKNLEPGVDIEKSRKTPDLWMKN